MPGKTFKEPRAAASKAGSSKRGRAPTTVGKTLLAGGNPQIPKGDGDAPVRAYIAAMPGWKRDVGRRLDGLIARAVPGVRRAVRWNSAFYGVDGRSWFVSFHTFTNYVKVTFLRGTSLRPIPPGSSKQAEVRYLDVHRDEQIDEAQLTAWMRQAAALPGWVPGSDLGRPATTDRPPVRAARTMPVRAARTMKER